MAAGAGPPQQGGYAAVVARAWRDPVFKRRLLADPAGTLREWGIAVPAGMEIRIVEDTAACTHLVLPRAPQGELGEDELASASGGILFGGFLGGGGSFGGAGAGGTW